MLARNDSSRKAQNPDEEPDFRIDPDEAVRRAVAAARRSGALAIIGLPLLAVLGLLAWLATGIYMVNPGEQGVVRQFGREVGKTSPGLHYRFPAPFQAVDVVNVQAIRRIEVGFRTERGQPRRVPAEALMLTGDENIVDAQLIAQYRVRDPSLYLFRLRDPDQTLHAATQVAMRSVVGNMTIDDILTTGRAEAQEQAHQYLQTLMDEYQSGLLITDVKLQVVDPPDQVKDAFNEVVRAREDRERAQNEAQAYMEDILPKARGEAQRVVRAAEAYEAQRVLEAQGDISKFSAVLEEYRKARDVTRERLYLETVERVLASVGKVVVDGSVGDKAVPFLPLNEMMPNRDQSQVTSSPRPQAVPQPAPQPTPAPTPRPAATPARP